MSSVTWWWWCRAHVEFATLNRDHPVQFTNPCPKDFTFATKFKIYLTPPNTSQHGNKKELMNIFYFF